MIVSRRHTLILLTAAVALPGVALATSDQAKAAIVRLTNGRAPRPGRVKLDIPTIAENGNAVPVTITVESPMTASDHVTGIHLIAEKNPLPVMFSCRFGPRAGIAQVSARVRLADSQHVLAIAILSDGSAWSDGVDVLNTIAACIEE